MEDQGGIIGDAKCPLAMEMDAVICFRATDNFAICCCFLFFFKLIFWSKRGRQVTTKINIQVVRHLRIYISIYLFIFFFMEKNGFLLITVMFQAIFWGGGGLANMVSSLWLFGQSQGSTALYWRHHVAFCCRGTKLK